VAESAGTATLSVRRLNATNTVVSVDYATVDGMATNGLKYVSTSGTLAFAASETNPNHCSADLEQRFGEGTRTFKLTLWR